MISPKYGFQQAISPAAEWFDLDRSVKIMGKSNKTPDVDGGPLWDDIEKMICPTCGSARVKFLGESGNKAVPPETYFECRNCGRIFTFDDIEESP